MKFSTKTTYGLRAMIILAKNYKEGSISLAKISDSEKISLKYLERLFSFLKKAKLVQAEKGASGGYVLTKNPKQITILQIIQALEGKISPFHCLDEKSRVQCSLECRCNVTKVLSKVQNSIKKTLQNIKLSELT